MKTTFRLLITLSIALVWASCTKEDHDELDMPLQNNALQSTESAAPVPNQYIVTLRKGTLTPDGNGKSLLNNGKTYTEAKQSLNKKVLNLFNEKSLSGFALKEEQLIESYGFSIEGFAAKLNKDQKEALENNPLVIAIEQDYNVPQKFAPVKIKTEGNKARGGSNSQVTPYGITRVGGGQSYSGSKKAWILDTGIDLNHPDLNVNRRLSTSFVNTENSADDVNGHGSHVAGTVGAINNTTGVVGVAAGVELVAVKVVNFLGSGSTSWCISGLDYVRANASAGDVVNMSVGYPASIALDLAVTNTANQDIKFAIAAGNDTTNANTGPQPSPSRVNHANVYTISAMDANDNFAAFSNFGNPPVDYCAPGVNVLSTYSSGRYAYNSGTSMASPHVAGLLILGNVSSNGTVLNDPDASPDPIAHR